MFKNYKKMVLFLSILLFASSGVTRPVSDPARAALTALGFGAGAVVGSYLVNSTVSAIAKGFLALGVPMLAFGGWRLNNYSQIGLSAAVGAFLGAVYSYWIKPGGQQMSPSQGKPDKPQHQSFQPSQKKEPVVIIKDFDYSRDKDVVLALFEADRNFLQVSSGYNLDHDLRTRSIAYAQVPAGALYVKVLYEGENLAGFVTYYVSPGDQGLGVIPMLCVGKKFRSKGYAKQLGESVKEFFKQWGVGTIQWNVLKANKPGVSWYKKLGAELIDCRSYYRCFYTILN